MVELHPTISSIQENQSQAVKKVYQRMDIILEALVDIRACLHNKFEPNTPDYSEFEEQTFKLHYPSSSQNRYLALKQVSHYLQQYDNVRISFLLAQEKFSLLKRKIPEIKMMELKIEERESYRKGNTKDIRFQCKIPNNFWTGYRIGALHKWHKYGSSFGNL